MKNNKNISVCYSTFENIIIPESNERETSSGMIRYGKGNLFPNFLFDLYSNGSAILQSIVNAVVDYITAEAKVDKRYLKYNDLRKFCLDYVVTGYGVLEVIRNFSGQVGSINYVDAVKVRTNKTNDVFYYRDWSKNSNVKEEIITKFDANSTKGRSFIFIKNPLGKGVYSNPYWSSAIRSAVIDEKITTYHLNEISNNFQGNTVINLIGNPDQESVKQFERDFNEKFAGADNAAKTLILWSDTKDEAAQITKLGEDNLDKRYEALSNKILKNLFVAFRLTPALAGFPDSTTGFSEQEYEQASKLFARTVVKPIQREISDTLNNIIPNVVSFDEVEIEAE